MKLGILGGTFDPVHYGHLRLAIEALEFFGLDEVVFEVAAVSPFKIESISAPAEMRHAMVCDAIAGESRFRTSAKELRRSGTSYSVDTVETYAGSRSDLFYIVGADALKGLPLWKDPARLLELCVMAAGCRPGDDIIEILETLPEPWRMRIEPFPCPLLQISSSDIRARVAAGKSIRFLTPDSVVQTIEARRLYR